MQCGVTQRHWRGHGKAMAKRRGPFQASLTMVMRSRMSSWMGPGCRHCGSRRGGPCPCRTASAPSLERRPAVPADLEGLCRSGSSATSVVPADPWLRTLRWRTDCSTAWTETHLASSSAPRATWATTSRSCTSRPGGCARSTSASARAGCNAGRLGSWRRHCALREAVPLSLPAAELARAAPAPRCRLWAIFSGLVGMPA
mmetsp:Transcript_65065/g.139361  ORF Transcript_65065/g.139361 Transcript_65065/m.139361 type:complete len:200 (+) Transcript_65065:329-928(+)